MHYFLPSFILYANILFRTCINILNNILLESVKMPSSPGEMTVNILILLFVGCWFIGCVGCTSALLKKCYDKYVLNVQEVQTDTFQNLESRYAKATVSIIHEECQEIDLVEVHVCGYEQDGLVETNIIAEEI